MPKENRKTTNTIFPQKQKTQKKSYEKKHKSHKSFVYFILVLCSIVFLFNLLSIYYKTQNLKEDLKIKAIEMYDNFLTAGKLASNLDIDEAKYKISQITEDFDLIKESLWFVSSSKNPNGTDLNLIDSTNNTIKALELFLEASNHGLNALESLNHLPIVFVQNNKLDLNEKKSITKDLKVGLEDLKIAIEKIEQAQKLVNEIDEGLLPKDLKTKVKSLKENLNIFSKNLVLFKDSIPAILKLLGDQTPHKYLIIFQNNDEIRPTGGFIGSYAILELNQGIIEKLEVNDVYDLNESLDVYIKPPSNLETFINNLRFRDANYSYNFPTSAKALIDHLQREGGESVDTVIAINQGILPELLYITGPVQVGDFALLDADNVNTILTYIIESKIWGAEDPKHILKVFVESFKNKALNEKYIPKILSKVYKAIQKEHVLLYSKDEDIQKLFEEINGDGKAHKTLENEDYLAVINTSIGGNKSDKFVDEIISHTTAFNEDGSMINTVKIRKIHLYSPQILDTWIKKLTPYGITSIEDYIIDIMGRGTNKSMVQIYVPKGSILIDSNQKLDTLYDSELDKTYFLTEMSVKAAESNTLELSYKLPFSLDMSENVSVYKFFIDKQPGSYRSSITKDLNATKDFQVLETYSENILYADDLSVDRYYSALIKH